MSCFFALSALADPGPLLLWMTNAPAPGVTGSWQQDALPVGNGKLGAMVYGGVNSEQIQFNEDTIWGGQPHDYSNPAASAAHLAALQNESFNFTGDAPFLADFTSYLMGVPIREAAYQNPGAIVLNFPQSGSLNYMRSIDLNSATVNVHYDYNGVTYNRDIFASAPTNKVIVVHFTASQPGKITFAASFATPQTASYYTTGNDLVMHAAVSAIADARYYSGGVTLTNGVQYDARIRLIATGGTVTATGSTIAVTNANDVVLLLGVVSNVKSYNDLTAEYVNTCSNNVAAAAALGLAGLRLAQTNDYEPLFKRVVLDLGGNSRTNASLGYRKKQMYNDGSDPQLVTLDYQLGRYLMIAGSRPGSQALNLQGKWNDSTAPSWDSKMTLNINEEMNYWGAEVGNLSECTSPLFDMMQDLSVTGNKVATSTYSSSGWVVHHNTDLWRDAAPCNGNDGIWPSGGAWLCQHVWWHYLYTGDTNWLATNGYPLMKGAAQFFQGFLVPHPLYGWMVTCPSYSPEHDEGGFNVANIPSPTMDNELVRDLFNHVIAASQVLGADATFRANIATLLTELPPEQVGGGGQLQEWLEDVDGGGYDAGHRHCSHLVGLFPGDEISPFYTPVTAHAAKVSVDLRGYGTSSLTPWSIAWRFNLRDRLQDGDGAWNNLLYLYGNNKVSTNLIFADNNRQLDCIFGRMSGIAEMFLQSQSGDVFLLPALPTMLTNGMVSGLCARGGFEVDNLAWTNGHLAGATIYSKVGNPCRLRSKMPVDIRLGSNYVNAPMVMPGLYQFSTVAGSNYTVVPATIFEAENLACTTNGAALLVITNAAYSNLRGAWLGAGAANAYVSFTLSNLVAGNYHLRVAADAGANRGKFQLACGGVGSALTSAGAVQDTYSPTNLAYLLPTKLTTTTNLIELWTNLVQELDCGTWQAPSNGNYTFKFTVTGKNAASTGYGLALDYVKLTPVINVVTPDQAPLTPTNLAPASGMLNQPVTPTLQASPFIDPDAGDTQAASEWLVQQLPGNTTIFDSGTDTVHLVSLTPPPGALNFGASYNWQARYEDNHGLWSSYSAATAFTTVAPALVPGGWSSAGMVISWPTNTAGLVLQYSTNLTATNWQPVAVSPTVINGNNVLTNQPAASQNVYYRLGKP